MVMIPVLKYYCQFCQDPAHFTGSEIRFRDPDMPKVYLAFAFRGAGWKDPDSVPLMVMQTILGRPFKLIIGILLDIYAA